MSIERKILDNLSSILDKESYSNCLKKDFYNILLLNLKNEVYFSVSSIYFLDDISLNQKAFISENQKTSNKIFNQNLNMELLKLLSSRNNNTFVLNFNEISKFLSSKIHFSKNSFLFSKLLIKDSFFGFAVFIKDGDFNDDEISIINLYLRIYSYIIKDFELNQVFKTQLNILQDAISDKENAYKTIEKQNKKLIQADNTKTNFLANISHELRTPLNAIIGFSEALLNQVFGKLNNKQLEYLKEINIASIRLMGLINSLLDFSKIESGSIKLNLTEFYPKTAINEVINLLSPLLNAKELNIEYLDDYNKPIKADYQKFQQILTNLIGNSIKFSPPKSKINVKTKKSEEYFILEVEDFGIGIEKKHHNIIFKKFTQIDNIYTKNFASTGLGLAITKEYVKLHKGKIYVESKIGHGSTFVVKLNNKL